MKQKKNVKKGNRTITIAFYTVYFVLVAVIVAGLLYADQQLEVRLEQYEDSHHTNRSQAIFQEHFASPDWAALCSLTGLEDTVYEDSDAFVAYMEEKTAGRELIFAEDITAAGEHRYLLMAGEESIGWFTIADRAPKGSFYPDWQLDAVFLSYSRSESVTVSKPEGVTVFVNGVALTNDDTVRIVSTLAEDYLPEGHRVPRTHVQQLAGLICEPVVTAQDSTGAALEVIYDAENDIYSVYTEPAVMAEAQRQVALEAARTYALYQLKKVSTFEMSAFFDTTAEGWADISGAEFWMAEAPAAGCVWGEASFSDYRSYGEDLFSLRVTLPLSVADTEGTPEEYLLDQTFLFLLSDGSWKCIRMTSEDLTRQTTVVRVTYMLGDTVLYTNFYTQDTAVLEFPILSTPAGKEFAGWFRQEPGDNGDYVYALFAGPDSTAMLVNTPLEPVTLYALYKDAE